MPEFVPDDDYSSDEQFHRQPRRKRTQQEILQDKAARKRDKKIEIKWGIVIPMFLLALVVIFVRPYIVPSASMEPTLDIGDRMLAITRPFANGHTYERGDIVVFRRPDTGETYVKRVIGVGGDTVEINGENVYVNGVPSPYQGSGGVATRATLHAAEDEYICLGDNRGNSYDSRFFGAVPADKMIGKIVAIIYPVNHWEFFGL